jgi:hypothetical protein
MYPLWSALGLNFIVLPKTENLLREAGRFWELLIGYICAVFSAASAALLVWLVYLVAWRNPQEYGVHDLFKVSTFLIFFGSACHCSWVFSACFPLNFAQEQKPDVTDAFKDLGDVLRRRERRSFD